jgi:hypothetical protein
MQLDLRASGSRQIVYRNRSQPLIGMLLVALGLVAFFVVCGDETILILRSTEKMPPAAPTQKLRTKIASIRKSTLVAEGNISFTGIPIQNLTDSKPTIWFRNEETGKRVKPKRIRYKKGYFQVFGLTPAKYGILVNVDANQDNPRSYPGDYRKFTTFDVHPEETSKVEVSLAKIIHLRRPQDNNKIMVGWDEPVNKIAWQSPVVFEWDNLGDGTLFVYSIKLVQSNPWKILDGLEVGETSDTRVEFNLPVSQPGQFYQFDLYGSRYSERMAMLITRGNHGYGWDYRFKIKSN